MSKNKNMKKCKNCGKFKNCKCEKIESTNSVAVVTNEISIIENKDKTNEQSTNEQQQQNTANEKTMHEQYIEFLNELNANYTVEQIDDNEFNFIIIANKKHIFVKINNITNHSNVFTVLNKYMSNDLQQIKMYARNILTLKSLKATKSYTLSNMK